MTERPGAFVQEGQFWSISYAGTSFRLRDTKGLHYLSTLLQHPGREFHVLELTGSAANGVAPAAAADAGLHVDNGDVGEVLDAQAKASYRRRLSELRAEAEEAEDFNDPERAFRARTEIDALEQQLTAAFGLGGRARKTGSAAERARVNVRNSIASSLRTIGTHAPELAEHLKKAVRTGTFCWYAGEGWGSPGQRHPDGLLSVMIVDDHPMWRQTLRAVLEGSGVGRVVAEASDGQEAIDTALAARPEAVIMDMNLIAMNGVTATRRILEELPDTKVLMLSSSDERDDVVEAVHAGASGYLLKTAGPEEVADAVTRIRAGELVFPPALAKVVLDEFRRRGGANTGATKRKRG